MKIAFYLYKNALARHIVHTLIVGGSYPYAGAYPSANTTEYKLIAQFPECMYKDVKKLVESYHNMHSNLDISVYDSITAEQSGFAYEYKLIKTTF